MKFLMTFCILFLIPLLSFSQDWIPEGKKRTARTISLKTLVDAPPEEVFGLWISEEGARRFFGVDASINPVVGGEYSIYFDSQDRRLSSEGSKILRIEPPNFLAFEWRGRPEMTEMNLIPLPTWAEVSFEPADKSGNATRVRLSHYGFGTGGTWDAAYEFFTIAWTNVLNRLQKIKE
jgi:uncharacterized protein YndB with AHSA1/START domain